MFSQYNVEMQARARQADIRCDARHGRRRAGRETAQREQSMVGNWRLWMALGGAVFAVLLAGLLLAAMAHAGPGLPLPL
jgi:hypothetical protein